MNRRVRQQQTEPDRRDHGGLAKIVRPVQNVESWTELDVNAFDGAETRNAQLVELHTSRPIAS
jgi:hypothetical protein